MTNLEGAKYEAFSIGRMISFALGGVMLNIMWSVRGMIQV